MVVTEKNFSVLADLYNEILRQIMIVNGIREIRCDSETERFFDRVVLKDGKIEVYSYGLKEPFSRLGFDFTIDYARAISYIEDDLFYIRREGLPKHGLAFFFEPRR